MKLYVDDIRETPDESWTLVRTITEAINTVSHFGWEIKEISLDHDISLDVRIDGQYRPFPSPDNFTAVAHFIGLFYSRYPEYKYPKITVHSANPTGAESIKNILADFGVGCYVVLSPPAHRK